VSDWKQSFNLDGMSEEEIELIRETREAALGVAAAFYAGLHGEPINKAESIAMLGDQDDRIMIITGMVQLLDETMKMLIEGLGISSEDLLDKIMLKLSPEFAAFMADKA
jgi:hypothetical protein